MQADVPAALPLIAYVAGLTCGLGLRDAAALIAVAILLAALKRARAFLIVCCLALGVVNARPSASLEVSAERFVTVEAPIDRDWAARGDAFLLRVPYRGNPLTIYARFAPKAIAMEKFVHAEGDRKSTRLNSSHHTTSRMPSSA